MGIFALVLLSSIVYLFPLGGALERRHPKTAGIAILNVLLGWTFVGWVIALIWAINEPFSVKKNTSTCASPTP